MQSACCPCCGFSGYLRPYQRRFDIYHRLVKIEICNFCTCIIDRTNLDEAIGNPDQALSVQKTSSDVIYNFKRTDLEIAREIEASDEGIVRFMFDNAGKQLERKVAIDFGAGVGFLAAAACRRFDRVFAVELNKPPIVALKAKYQLDNLEIIDNIDHVETDADAVFMWHTLEHLPFAWKVVTEIVKKIRIGGVLFVQVPMYADAHVVYSHYAFYNENSFTVFAQRVGLKMVGLFHDETNQFLSFLGAKP